jgi:hypothetical protein
VIKELTQIEIDGKTYEGELNVTKGRWKTQYLESDGVIIAKVCTRCSEWRLIEESFAKLKSGLGGKLAYCYECNRKRCLNWHYSNKEKSNGDSRAWYESNRERAIKNSRNWNEDNKERQLENQRKWKQENREKSRLYDQRRRARIAALPDTLTDEQIKSENEFYGNRCPLTGKTEKLTVEHVIPVKWNHGGTTLENCYPMEFNANNSKNGSNIFEWLQQKTKSFYDRSEYDVFNFWETVIKRKAAQNGMSIVEFIAYVNYCDIHRKTDHEVKALNKRKEKTDSVKESEEYRREMVEIVSSLLNVESIAI